MSRALWLVLAMPVLAAAARKPITIDDLLISSESAAVSPVWSPDGNSFVFERGDECYLYQNGASKPKLWFDLGSLKSPPEKEGSAAPFNWRNRRVSSALLQWFPNGEELLASQAGSLF